MLYERKDGTQAVQVSKIIMTSPNPHHVSQHILITGATGFVGRHLSKVLVEKGAKVFKKCSACHKLEDGANGTGPYLYGVVGRPIGSASGFGYSSAMAAKGGDWTPEALDAFLLKPSADIPGTSMSFAGLKKQGDRVNLIAYLDSLDN